MKCLIYLSKTEVKCSFCSNTLEKVVWIVGHSYVKWTESRAEVAWEPNLGLQKRNVQWLGKGGMRWSQLLDVFFSTEETRCPDTACWGKWPGIAGVWISGPLSRRTFQHSEKIPMPHWFILASLGDVWQWGEGRKMNKARKFINSAMATYTAETGGVFISHKDITWGRRTVQKGWGSFTRQGKLFF